MKFYRGKLSKKAIAFKGGEGLRLGDYDEYWDARQEIGRVEQKD